MGSAKTMEQSRGDELPDEALAGDNAWPREARGLAATWLVPSGSGYPPAGASPGGEGWAVWRRNLDGSEPRYYLSNAPEDTTLETLACRGWVQVAH